jgi:phage baseplate assembly protein W
MRPDYGCNLQELVFAPNDYTTAGLAIHYVRQAVRQWEPRADVIRLDAYQDENDPGKLNIELEYRVKGTHKLNVLKYSFSLNEDET